MLKEILEKLNENSSCLYLDEFFKVMDESVKLILKNCNPNFDGTIGDFLKNNDKDTQKCIEKCLYARVDLRKLKGFECIDDITTKEFRKVLNSKKYTDVLKGIIKNVFDTVQDGYYDDDYIKRTNYKSIKCK